MTGVLRLNGQFARNSLAFRARQQIVYIATFSAHAASFSRDFAPGLIRLRLRRPNESYTLLAYPFLFYKYVATQPLLPDERLTTLVSEHTLTFSRHNSIP